MALQPNPRMLLSLLALPLALGATSTVFAQAPDLPHIVEKMAITQKSTLQAKTPYELLRQYQVFDGNDGKAKTELLAKIQYAPPGQKSYTIEHSTGGMGEKAIRHALDHEVDLTKSPDRVAMTEQNYTFTYLGEDQLDGHRCYLLESHPVRNDRDLLKAKVWVDAGDYHIRRIQGHPQKSPSFWVKDLDLTLEYSESHGMWMHTATRADAQIRFGGPFTMVSKDVSLRLSPDQESAQLATAAHRSRPQRHAVLAGAAIPRLR